MLGMVKVVHKHNRCSLWLDQMLAK